MRARTPTAAFACLTAAVCALGACSAKPDQPLFDTLDPHTIRVDAGSPRLLFGSEPGSIVEASGWTAPAMWGTGETRTLASWVDGTEATVYVQLPPDGPFDFYARCLPFPWSKDGPTQRLELFVEGRRVAEATLEPAWQEIRLPLPDDLPRTQPLEFQLRFAHALRPVDLGMNKDSRALAATFSLIALVPRDAASPEHVARTPRMDPDRRTVTLPAGGTLALPLPGARSARLPAGALSSDAAHGRLTVLLDDAGQTRQLWTGPAAAASSADVSFETSQAGASRLRIVAASVNHDASGIDDASETIEIRLGSPLVLVTPADTPAPARPDVFVYAIDTLRADALELYGGTPEATPRFSAFALDSVIYSNAYSTSSWTFPSVASLMTGFYPDLLGVSPPGSVYEPGMPPTLAARLGEAGYHTLGLSMSFVVGPLFGLDAGFRDFAVDNRLGEVAVRSERARSALLTMIGRTNGAPAPLFAYLHTVDPHAPYSPPEDARRLSASVPAALDALARTPAFLSTRGLTSTSPEAHHLKSLYQDEVSYADEQFGRFLDLLRRLGRYDDSLIIVTSDHGEEFADHDGFGHGRTLFEELVRVPLLVKYPRGQWAGTAIEAPVSLVDVVPTVLDVAGLASGDSFDGVSIVPAEIGADATRRPVHFMVTPEEGAGLAAVDLTGVAVSGLKCIESRTPIDQFGRPVERWRAFDLDRDPEERQPLPDASGVVRACQALVAERSARAAAGAAGRPARALPPGVLDRLRALGYIR